MKLVSPLPHRKGRLEIIPLIDIMFFLLAAFMLVSINKIKVKSLKVNLPTDVPAAQQEKKEDFISLSIKEDGSIQLDKEVVPNVQALLPKLQALFAANHDQKFLISADQEARHGDVMRVLGRLRSAGFQKVAFSVKPDGVMTPDQAAPVVPPPETTPARARRLRLLLRPPLRLRRPRRRRLPRQQHRRRHRPRRPHQRLRRQHRRPPHLLRHRPRPRHPQRPRRNNHVTTMPSVQPSEITDYPAERTYAREAIGVSVGAHILVVVIVAIIAIIFHVKSLRDLMLQGGSIEMHAPPPEEHIEVFLKDELPPPPPVVTPEFIRQIQKPVPKPVVIEKPKPKPPQPTPVVAQPRVQMESRLVVGTSGLPHPGYPTKAKLMHISGTVMISVTFDSTGKAVGAEVVSSSGSSMLDSPARSFILENWNNESFAGKTETVPIEFHLQ